MVKQAENRGYDGGGKRKIIGRRQPLLPQVFARRERLLPAQWDSTAWEKAQGVELHPLARILAVEESGDEGEFGRRPIAVCG